MIKGILGLIFGILAALSGTLGLAFASPILNVAAIIFWCPGTIFGNKAWNQSKSVVGLIGLILSLIGLIEAIIFSFTYLMHY